MQPVSKSNPVSRIIYIVLAVMVVLPIDLVIPGVSVSPAFALFLGLFFAMVFECPYPKFNKKTSK